MKTAPDGRFSIKPQTDAYGIAVLQGLLRGAVHLTRELRSRQDPVADSNEATTAVEP